MLHFCNHMHFKINYKRNTTMMRWVDKDPRNALKLSFGLLRNNVSMKNWFLSGLLSIETDHLQIWCSKRYSTTVYSDNCPLHYYIDNFRKFTASEKQNQRYRNRNTLDETISSDVITDSPQWCTKNLNWQYVFSF